MTKPVISVAVLQLIERGKLKRDGPISKYLSEWASVLGLLEDGETSWQQVSGEQPITVRHLLRHTSELCYPDFERGELEKIYRTELAKNGKVKSLDEFSKRLAALPLKHQPGTAFNDDHSTDALGRLVEVVAEQPIDACVKEYILDPLEMVDTTFHITVEDLPNLASVHKVDDDDKIVGVVPGSDDYIKVRFASWFRIVRTYFVNDHLTGTRSLLFTQTEPFDFDPGDDFHKVLQKVLVED